MNRTDDAHDLCVKWLSRLHHDHRLLIPTAVVIEVCQLVASRQGSSAEAEFLHHLADNQQFKLWTPDQRSLKRMALLVAQYSNFPLGAADAAVIACSEWYKTSQVATLDRRHFRAVRPAHAATLKLLPDGYPG